MKSSLCSLPSFPLLTIESGPGLITTSCLILMGFKCLLALLQSRPIWMAWHSVSVRLHNKKYCRKCRFLFISNNVTNCHLLTLKHEHCLLLPTLTSFAAVHACMRKDAPIATVELLLSLLPEGLRKIDCSGRTPLHVAAGMGASLPCIQLLSQM